MSDLPESEYEITQSAGDQYEPNAAEVWEIRCHLPHLRAHETLVYALSREIVFQNLTMEDLNMAMREHHERFHA